MNKNSIDCIKCKYFFVTWDKNFPKGCKFFGFKSFKAPYFTVREATGADCRNFEPKIKE